MRHPSLILAATMLLSNGASAIVPPRPAATSPSGLPNWTAQEEPWGTWRIINFVDDSGGGHEVWCRWTDCGRDKHSGTAKLYVFVRKGSVPYTYKEHFWSDGTASSKTNYDTQLSRFTLDMSANPHKAVVAGTTLAFPVDDRPQAVPTGYMLIVTPPKSVADDLPKKPRQGAALTGDEKYWLAPTLLTAYTHDSAAADSEEKLLAVEHTARHGVEVALPSFARAKYENLTKLPIVPSKVSEYLDGLIAIRKPEELQKLSEIKKGAGVGATLKNADALAEYKAEMGGVHIGEDGRPVPDQNLHRAVSIVSKFRGMLAGHTGKKPSTGNTGDRSAVVLHLSAEEMNWLAPTERTAYIARGKAVLKESKANQIQLFKSARDTVEKNLRPDGVAAYQAARAEMDPAAIAQAILAVKPYSGDEIQLNAAEVDALVGVTKDKAPSLQNDNAKQDYTAEMLPYKITGGQAATPSTHLVLHAITVRYRQMLTAAGIKVPGAPDVAVPASTSPVTGVTASTGAVVGGGPRKTHFSADELKLLTSDERTIYDTLKTDDERADYITAHQTEIDDRAKMMKDPPTTAAQFGGLTRSNKKKFCEPILAASNGGAAAPATETKALKQATNAAASTEKADATMVGNTTLGDVISGPAKSTAANPAVGGKSDFDDAAKLDLCKKYAAELPRGGNIAGGGPKDVPTPGGQPGSDKDGSPKEKKPDPNFYRNITNGAGFGLFGLILGSFFGGPLVMLAAAAIIGGGAFMLSKHINKPKDDN